MAILGNAGPVDPGGVFSAVLAVGISASPKEEDKDLTLQQLRKFYTQSIQESLCAENKDRENQLANRYVNALIARYEQAFQKNDYKTMDKIARYLWDGVPGSFKCAYVVQNKKTGKLEARCGAVAKETKSNEPTACDLSYQHYLSKLARLRGLMKKAVAWRKQVKTELDSYREIIDLAFDYETSPQLKRKVPLGEIWDKLYTEENRDMVEEILNSLDRLHKVRATIFMQAYEKAEETGGKKEWLYLIRLAAQAKEDLIELDRYEESGMEVVNAEIRTAYNEVKKAEGPYAETCNIEPSEFISENGGMFSLERRGEMEGPRSFDVIIYNEEGAVEDSFYV